MSNLLKYISSSDYFQYFNEDFLKFIELNTLNSDHFMIVSVFIISCICITVICILALFFHNDSDKINRERNLNE